MTEKELEPIFNKEKEKPKEESSTWNDLKNGLGVMGRGAAKAGKVALDTVDKTVESVQKIGDHFAPPDDGKPQKSMLEPSGELDTGFSQGKVDLLGREDDKENEDGKEKVDVIGW